MMALGTSIRVYLADGTVTGIRHAEVVNWTGQALSCPRVRIGELGDWDEARRPGVYLLFGTDESSDKPAVYIGEAENVFDRLQSHLSQKDFWTEIILFSNKDENLTKAHVRYLEAKLTEMARTAKRYEVKNGNQPQPALLPRGDRDSMESFLAQARLLLGVLGHKVLEPITAFPTSVPASNANAAPHPATPSASEQFHLTAKGVTAQAVMTDEGVVILSGSGASAKSVESISPGYKRLREQLLQQGVLVPDGTNLKFSQDHLFSSPSAAACVVVGAAINGREAWRTSGDKSLADLESQQLPIQ
jgi:hypothetical protein